MKILQKLLLKILFNYFNDDGLTVFQNTVMNLADRGSCERDFFK